MRSLQRALLGCNNFWIHVIFREFYWVSMSKLFNPPLQMESWARCLGGRVFFPFQRKSYIFFQITFWYILPQFGYEDAVYDYLFSSQRSLTLFQIRIFFIIPLLMLSQFELKRIELPKSTPIILMENCDRFIFPGWSILFLYPSPDKA